MRKIKRARIALAFSLLALLISGVPEAHSSSVLKFAEYRGRLFIEKEWVTYSLIVKYSDDFQNRISDLELVLGDGKIEIPKEIFQSLKQVNSVDPPRPNIANPGEIRVRVFGGDGAKAYQVDIITDTSKFIKMDWRKRGE